MDNLMMTRLQPRGFLSFGPDFPGIDLRQLNVLIGPNGCGKSNLIDVIAFMRAAPKDFQEVTRKGGGVGEWIHKGNRMQGAEVSLDVPMLRGPYKVYSDSNPIPDLRHIVRFTEDRQAFRLLDERVEEAEKRDPSEQDVYFYYRFQDGSPAINTENSGERPLARETVQPNLSILAQRRDPEAYPRLARLARGYEGIRIYREWQFGPDTPCREPQKADMAEQPLAEDFSNLGLFLNQLLGEPEVKRRLLDLLSDLFAGASDLHVSIKGGTVQVFLIEGNYQIPATRLSDGTLRYLCLLCIFLDPNPPDLVCIEEPELGLHPDLIPKVADLIVELSERTQVIVTTHSEMLVDCITERPEVVIVCEKHKGQTQMQRLEQEELAVWLENYRLGQLWIDGEIGGKRW